MPRVVVVTDSTAYLPDGVAREYAVAVVPLQISFGERSGAEGDDVRPAEVAAALGRRGTTVTTSRPTPAAFTRAWREAAERADARAVVSVHLSGRLSGTIETARLAAQSVDTLDVRIVDSRSLAMGLGFAVIAAAEAAAAGAPVDEVVETADAAGRRTQTLFCVDTLEHLRRGGRIGAAAGLLGTALAVKPILHVVDGQIAPLEKVRTSARALARLADLAVEAAGEAAVDIAVHHLAAPERAGELAERLRARLPLLATLHLSEVGAVVGAHTGPGLVGVVVYRRG